VDRRRVAHFAAPAAFLAAVTIGVLLVRSGLERGSHPAKTRTTTHVQTVKRKVTKRHHVRLYTVQVGDTFESIAGKTGTTASRLEQLNPRVDPTALRVGEKIRVQ
jgi:LysM repeat protein